MLEVYLAAKYVSQLFNVHIPLTTQVATSSAISWLYFCTLYFYIATYRRRCLALKVCIHDFIKNIHLTLTILAVGTPKYVANKMKSKGLQRLRWYCQVCEKQCRDENGFKCHAASESHLRQMLVVGEHAGGYIAGFSNQFQSEFVSLLSRRSSLTLFVFFCMVFFLSLLIFIL